MDILFALLRHTVALSGYSGRGRKPEPKDFIVEWDKVEPSKEDTVDLEQWEIDKAKFEAFAKAWGNAAVKGQKINARNNIHVGETRA